MNKKAMNIKPCPECGSEEIIFRHSRHKGYTMMGCNKCKAVGELVKNGSETDAIAAWNDWVDAHFDK